MTKKVLIVDDNEKNRKLLRVILAKAGYETLEAENGRKAVDLAREMLPDIILMDYRMPVMDGIEATKIIKNEGPTSGIPVFIITSSAMAGEQEQIVRESGCDTLYTKPFDYRVILQAVKQRIGE
jgi:two-component system cell cycle response regulator DivK